MSIPETIIEAAAEAYYDEHHKIGVPWGDPGLGQEVMRDMCRHAAQTVLEAAAPAIQAAALREAAAAINTKTRIMGTGAVEYELLARAAWIEAGR